VSEQPAFPNYMQMKRRLPIWVWRVFQLASIATALGACYWLATRPERSLGVFWGLVVPALPLVFFLAPGLWRNVCPLGATNQLPRLLGLSLARTAPPWFREYNYVIGIALFFALASGRKVIFNDHGPAAAGMVLAALAVAFLGGVLFKGKSGWCSSICPLLPVQRIYGQTPFVTLPNSHCQPCVGCTKNCYDFNPKVAYIADQYDEDENYAGYRKFFVSAFPGFIVAFYQVPNPPEVSLGSMYLQFGLYMLVSVGSFFVLDAFLKVSSLRITTLYAAGALNLFYYFSAPAMTATAGALLHASPPDWTRWILQALVGAATVVWILRTYAHERLFIAEVTPVAAGARVGDRGTRALERAVSGDRPAVTFESEDLRVLVEPGRNLLQIAESNNLPIEAGCRMGMCGSDPVTIRSGMENLSQPGADELSTIERLGLGENTRMACCARVNGNVWVSLEPEHANASRRSAEPLRYDTDVKSVVIIGNGIAGITAADHVRRRHPDCEIHVIGREKYHLYNRMAISRLIYGRSGMQGLTLMPESWYEERNITCWLNTRATGIDVENREVRLGISDTLTYDRLIVTTGSESFVPPVPGFDTRGAFVLREAEDAMQIRAYAQEFRCRQAVVAGGGLLGLEAAFALHELGLDVAVLERGPWLLRRQLDEQGAGILRSYLEGLGIQIVLGTETAALESEDGQLRRVRVKPEGVMRCDLFLVCAGISPNVDLGKEAGLESNRGLLVDDAMRTSDPAVFAAGDAAEHHGRVYGLWPAAVKQAEVAAANAVGGDAVYEGTVPETILKVAGIDLVSIGRFDPRSPDDDVVITELDDDAHRYRKLVITDGQIAGAILIGYSTLASTVSKVIQEERDVNEVVDALRAGDWSVLEGAVAA